MIRLTDKQLPASGRIEIGISTPGPVCVPFSCPNMEKSLGVSAGENPSTPEQKSDRSNKRKIEHLDDQDEPQTSGTVPKPSKEERRQAKKARRAANRAAQENGEDSTKDAIATTNGTKDTPPDGHEMYVLGNLIAFFIIFSELEDMSWKPFTIQTACSSTLTRQGK